MNRSLNLMPESSTRRRITSEAIGLWVRVLVVVGLVVGGTTALKMWRREDAHQRLIALEAQHEPIEQLRGEIKLLQARINSVQTSDALALTIANSPPPLALLAGVVDAAGVFAGEAYLKEFSYQTDPTFAEPPTLIVEGVARDPAAIQRFVEALDGSGCFSSVRLGETEARLLRGTATTAFGVECTL